MSDAPPGAELIGFNDLSMTHEERIESACFQRARISSPESVSPAFATFYVAPFEWLRTYKRTKPPLELMTTGYRMALVMPWGPVYVVGYPLQWGSDIYVDWRRALSYEACIVEGERWMQLATEARVS